MRKRAAKKRAADLNELGQYIKKRRLELELTQKELGEAIPWDNGKPRAGSTVAGYEGGYAHVPNELLPALARALDVPVEQLLRIAGVLQNTPGARLAKLAEELELTHEDVDNYIEVIRMILNNRK